MIEHPTFVMSLSYQALWLSRLRNSDQNPKVVGSIPTLVSDILCPCVSPFPFLELTF